MLIYEKSEKYKVEIEKHLTSTYILQKLCANQVFASLNENIYGMILYLVNF